MSLKDWLAIHLGTRLLRVNQCTVSFSINPYVEFEVSGEVLTDLTYSNELGLTLPAPRPPQVTLKFNLEYGSQKYKDFLNANRNLE